MSSLIFKISAVYFFSINSALLKLRRSIFCALFLNKGKLSFKSKYVFTLFILCFFISIEGQYYKFERLTTREGLSQNDVNNVFQDSRGFLWIGTNDGLNRYDGYNCKIYRVDPLNEEGISSNLIYSISEDSEGNLWLGTSDEGVCKFDVKKEKFITIKNTPENPDLIQSNKIKKIIPTQEGEVWLGTTGGINIISQKGNDYEVEHVSLIDFSVNNAGDITDMEMDNYGRIWVGTLRGLYVISTNNGKREVKTIQPYYYVRDLFIVNNEVYVCYLHGIYRLRINWEDLSNVQPVQINDLYASSLIKDSKGNIYVGTYQGLYFLEEIAESTLTFKQPVLLSKENESQLLSNKITSLIEDKYGNIWIGTNGGGVNKYNKSQKKFKHYKKTNAEGSLSYNKVRSIHEDSDDNLWIGTDNGGVSFLSKDEGKNYATGFKSIDVNVDEEDKSAISILDIGQEGEPELLVGTSYPYVVQVLKVKDGEVQREDSEVLSQIENEPFSVMKDKNGDVWIGTYGKTGLYRYIRKGNENRIIRYFSDGSKGSLSSDIIRSLLEDSYGNIWIGTDKGLNLLTLTQRDKEKPEFIVFKKDKDNPESITHNYILPIFQSDEGTIWVGTMGGGLNKLIYHSNPDSIKFKAVTTNDGLPSNVIKGILEDDYGFLWISSNRGLSRYDVQENQFSNFDISDGLQDYEFGELACCKRSDGEMLFGGVNGINAFYPNAILKDMTVPDLVLTDLQILNRPVKVGEVIRGRVVLENVINQTDRIKLKYVENNFEIHFSSLHFGAPSKNKYKYMLEGFDTDWVRKGAGDRIAKYTNLKPGEYRFKLLASNSDGAWATSPKFLYVEITPPWYLSTLAKVFYIIFIVALLLVFRRYSLIRVKLKNNLLMEHFETEKIKELSQMKLQFFTNISHEFRTPLSLIIGPLERLMHKSESLTKSKIAESYSLMHRNASILLRLINQLIDFRKYEQGKMKLKVTEVNIIHFLKEVFVSFTEFADIKKIDYNFSHDTDGLMVWFDEEKMERIMYNLISNALKFTSEKGKVQIDIKEDEKEIVIKVQDTGIGIPKEMQKHIFERFYHVDQIENKRNGGAGIGLSFIKGLVEMHKGNLSFESEENKGTAFILKLKKGNAHFEKQQIHDRVGSNIINEVVYHETKEDQADDSIIEIELENNLELPRVLVVEDNYELSSFIKESLSGYYQVHLSENGKLGLDYILGEEVDIVISDVMMPQMDGYELCESIKSNEKISHVPIILLTAKSDTDSRVKSYDVGADGYISKPFSLEVLEARVQNLLKSRELLKEKLRSNISIEPSEVTTTSMDENFLQRVLRIVDKNIPNPEFSVEQLASDYGMSQVVFHRKLKGLTGQTPKIFIRTMRLKRAAKLFAMNKYSISEVTYEVGFSDLKYFRNCFKEEFGMLPMQYMKKHRQ